MRSGARAHVAVCERTQRDAKVAHSGAEGAWAPLSPRRSHDSGQTWMLSKEAHASGERKV
jgi:hypothetical protein